MAVFTNNLAGFGLLTVLVLWVIKNVLHASRRSPLPPGPRPLPLIGNVFDMPTAHPWRKFAEWGNMYGDVVSVTTLGQRVVILNSLQAATDLLEKRSSIYSDRPPLLVAGEMIGWDQTVVLSPYGERLRDMRRMAHQFIGSQKHMTKFHGLIEEEVHKFLKYVLNDSDGLRGHIRKTAGAIILRMSYGYIVKSGHDEMVELVERSGDSFGISSAPGAFMVEFLPFLRFVPSWIPGAGWKKQVEAWKVDREMTCDLPYHMSRNGLAERPDAPTFISENIEHTKDPKGEYNVKMAAASLYAGGADTTVSTAYTFFLAMTLHPEIQKKAQAEIDAVVGNGRLPSFSDWDDLPYLRAICSELLRWQPIAPLGAPHRSTEDDTYRGYFFPKGTMFIMNIWNMLHDPQTYRDPMAFKPERFLEENGNVPEQDPRVAVFGFGRRSCPGMHLAEASLYITCAMILAVFNISKTVENGKEIVPDVEYCTGTVSHPLPFKCTIKPRSAEVQALIVAEYA